MSYNTENLGSIIDREATMLLDFNPFEAPMPSSEAMVEIMQKLTNIVFYEFAPRCNFANDRLRRLLYDVYIMLGEQIAIAAKVHKVNLDPHEVSLHFVEQLHDIRRVLYTDVEAIKHNDPAAQSPHEIVSSYPAIKALLHYRTAHCLSKLGVPILPRMITEFAHSATGIDIHPGAVIGEYFGIDHGTGVVIGETCIIGNHVTIYQGVTLGAKNFEYDVEGNPLNVPRHPIIEDNVTIYSNTSVLGRITVGHDTVIGGNVWLTNSVPPGSRIIQGKASETTK